MENKQIRKVPRWFQKFYWWGDTSSMDLDDDKKAVIVQLINSGTWSQWKWLVQTYGREDLKKAIQQIPASEFRLGALKLVRLLLGIKRMDYASRSDYIKAKRNPQKASSSS